MLAQNILFTCTAVFAAFASASPIQKRAVTVVTDNDSKSITTALTVPAQIDSFESGTSKADAASTVLGVINQAVQLVQGLIDKDIAVSLWKFPNLHLKSWHYFSQRRQRFTQETVSALAAAFPTATIVMSNVGYDLVGTPIVKQETSYKAKVGSNVSYDVLVIGAGQSFTLKGDGGFENVRASNSQNLSDTSN